MDAEFEYESDLESYAEKKEEAEPKRLLFPPIPLMPSLTHTRNASDVSINTENSHISAFLDVMLDESDSSETDDDSVEMKSEDNTTTESDSDSTDEDPEPAVPYTKKQAHTSPYKGPKGHKLTVSDILKESLEAPDSTNWDKVDDMRIEVLRRELRRSHVDCTSRVDVVEEKLRGKEGALGDTECDKPVTEDVIKSLDKHEDIKSATSMIINVEAIQDNIAGEERNHEDPEADDGDTAEPESCTDLSPYYLDECTPLQVFYQPYPIDIALPPVVPEVKIKEVRLSRTVMDILLRRTTPYVPPPERQGPKIWNTFQKVAEKPDVSPKKDKPKNKSFLRRLTTFFRKRSSKVVPVSS